MSRLLLRTMTLKSKIGFGKFKETTVGQLITIRNFKHLIDIYFNCELITFDKEVIEILQLDNPLLAIEKPGKDVEKGKKYGQMLADQLRDISGMNPKNQEHSENPMDNWRKRANVIRTIKYQSRMLNKNRVQK